MENRFHKKARRLGLHDPKLLEILDSRIEEDVVDRLLDYMVDGNFRYHYGCGVEHAPVRVHHKYL